MSWVAVGVGAVTAVGSIVKSSQDKKDKKKIAAEIAKQEAPPLENIGDGLQVSTLGANLQKEQAAMLAATQTDALQEGGTRAIVGGIGKVSANNMAVDERIAADLDRQQKDIDQIKAQDKANIRMTKEQRLQAKLAALSSQYNAANQSQAMNNANAIQGAGSAATAAGSYYSNKKPKTT